MKTIKDIDLKKKRVLVRVDFNVPIKDEKVVDNFRIRKCLPTIKFLQGRGARIILAAHLGRPEKRDSAYSLLPVKNELARLLNQDIVFVDDCFGEKVKEAVAKLVPGEVLLLENLRFYLEEEKNDEWFAKKLASLADIYINDAFSVSHRAHASVHKITKILPSFAGLLLENEIKNLRYILENPRHPISLVMGGAKVATKLKLINEFLPKAENIILGGVIANTILAAKGLSVGKSKLEENIDHKVLSGLDLTNPKLHLPLDVVVSSSITGEAQVEVIAPGSVKEEDIILDIGPETVKEYSQIIHSAKTIIWNGPMGYIETDFFAKGTKELAKTFVASNAYKVVGGGDVISILDKMNVLDKIDYVSTGGGAMLEFLAGDKLPGIEALK